MALRTQTTARQDAMASWWPSRYGADHIAGRLGAAGRHGVRPEPVTAHA